MVAGMSGSPVYFDGKLAGALAFRIGEFSKEPIAGVTPIDSPFFDLHEGARLRREIAAGMDLPAIHPPRSTPSTRP